MNGPDPVLRGAATIGPILKSPRLPYPPIMDRSNSNLFPRPVTSALLQLLLSVSHTVHKFMFPKRTLYIKQNKCKGVLNIWETWVRPGLLSSWKANQTPFGPLLQLKSKPNAVWATAQSSNDPNRVTFAGKLPANEALTNCWNANSREEK